MGLDFFLGGEGRRSYVYMFMFRVDISILVMGDASDVMEIW